MNWTLGKAEKQDTNRINELFIEMLRHTQKRLIFIKFAFM